MAWAQVANLASFPGGMLDPVVCCCDGSETYTIVGGTVTQITGTTISSGYAPFVGERILIPTAPAASGAGTQYAMTTQPANGVYVVTANSPNLLVARAPDMAGSNNPSGQTLFVQNHGNLYKLNFITVTVPDNMATFTYGTSVIQFHSSGGILPTFDQAYIQTALNVFNSHGWAALIGDTTAAGAQTLTLPKPATDNIVSRTSTDTLTNKTLTSPTLTTPTIASIKNTGTSTVPTTTSVFDAEQLAILASASPYTLTSQTAAQKLFNSSATGAVTLPIGTYIFECMFALSSLSATSSIFGFALVAGTAVIASQLWHAEAAAAALATPVAPFATVNTAASLALTGASTAGVGWAKITGVVRISTAGTIIPSVSLAQAAAAIVAGNSRFRIWQMGTVATTTTVGTWT